MTKQIDKDTNMLALTIDTLVEKRVVWEKGTFAASNSELYALLGDMLDLYIKVKNSYTLPKGVNALCDIKRVTYNSSTSLELKLLRLVFCSNNNEDRIASRLFTYARVIHVAAEAGQNGATLAQFITEHHGIDEIRRSGKDSIKPAEKQKELSEHARIQLTTPKAKELFANFVLPDQLQPVAGEHFSIALVRKNEDGSGSIVFGTDNVAVVNKVLSIAGKELHETSVKAAEQRVAQDDAAVRDANIAEFQASLPAPLDASTPSLAPQLVTAQNAHVGVPA